MSVHFIARESMKNQCRWKRAGAIIGNMKHTAKRLPPVLKAHRTLHRKSSGIILPLYGAFREPLHEILLKR